MKYDHCMRGQTVALPAAAVRVVMAAPVKEPKGLVAIGLGDTLADADFFAITVEDARRLARLLVEAVDGPATDVSS
jgi:hypothetical protein